MRISLLAVNLMSINTLFSKFTKFGFSGSRHGIDLKAGNSAAAAVTNKAEVIVGCAAGADAFFRSRFPDARIFRVDYSLGRAGFALRSMTCVEAVDQGLWVSFPDRACPEGLLPSALPRECFNGSGSGAWASLAYAIGRSGSVLVYLGSIPVPSDWDLVPVPNEIGWWQFQP
jgi:hypothetical protein